MKSKNKNWKPRVRVTMNTGTRIEKSVKTYSRKQKHKNSRFEY